MKKKYLIIMTLLIFLLLSCQAKSKFSGGFAIVYQEGTPYLLNKDGDMQSLAKYDQVGEVFGEYIVVAKYKGQKLKYGYIDHNGKEIIKPSYDMAYPFGEELAVVVKDENYLLINTKGKTVYHFENGMKAYDCFQEGFLKVEDNHQYRFLNHQFELSPSFDGVENYQEGYALCFNMQNGEKAYSIMDTNYQINLASTLAPYSFVDRIYNGWMRVGRYIDEVFYYSFMNSNGQILTDENDNQLFEDAHNFHSDLALVFTGQPCDFITGADDEILISFYSAQYIDTKGNYPSFSYVSARSRDKSKYLDKMIMGDFVGDYVCFRINTGGASYYTLNKKTGAGDSAYLDEIDLKAINQDLSQMEKDSYRKPYNIAYLKESNYYQSDKTVILCVARVYSDYYGIIDESGQYIFDALYERVIL